MQEKFIPPNSAPNEPRGIMTFREEAFIVNLCIQIRMLLLMCAPKFPEGSDGAHIVENARSSSGILNELMVRLREQNEETEDKQQVGHAT